MATQISTAPHRPIAKQIWEGYYYSKINLRYHLLEASWWGRCDRWSRAASFLLAVLALTGPLAYTVESWKLAWIILGILAFLVSVLPFLWPFGPWFSQDTILASRWNQLSGAWFQLYEEHEKLKDTVLLKRMARLRKATESIENEQDFSRFNKKVMKKAEDEEKEYQDLKRQLGN